MSKCVNDQCTANNLDYVSGCQITHKDDLKTCRLYKTLKEKKAPVANFQCSDVLFAELSLMLDVFNSCIETKTLPGKGSPCQKKIIELLDQCGKKPTALRVRGK